MGPDADEADTSTPNAPAPRPYPGPHAYPFRFIDRIDPPGRLAGSPAGVRSEERGGAGDGSSGGSPAVGISVGAVFAAVGQAGRTGHGGQGSGTGYSLALLVETMAQGALAALADPSGGGAVPDGASLRLAGVDDARLISPVVPGDRLTVEATVEGRFAALAKVACRLLRDGEPVAEAKLLLAGDWSRA